MVSSNDLIVTHTLPKFFFYKKHMDSMHAFTQPESVCCLKKAQLIISSCWLCVAAGDITVGHFMY